VVFASEAFGHVAVKRPTRPPRPGSSTPDTLSKLG
jgi:hypothetical protein